MYNVSDYLRIGGIRGKLSQCFSHTYQRKKYVFFVVYVYSIVMMEGGDIIVMDSVLDLSLYSRRGAQQHIYGLFILGDESLYMIEVPKESD